MIRKMISVLLAVILVMAITACGETPPVDSPQSSSQESISESSTLTDESQPALEESPPSEMQQSTSQEAIPESSENSMSSNESQSSSEESTMDPKSQNAIGAMSPEEALKYMKKTENLVIVDVAATRGYIENHFEGAINIPIEELDSEAEDALYMEIPADRPVLMHCRLGMIVPGAYNRVLELRPDIPEIAYIDGRPPFDAYNEWYAENH